MSVEEIWLNEEEEAALDRAEAKREARKKAENESKPAAEVKRYARLADAAEARGDHAGAAIYHKQAGM